MTNGSSRFGTKLVPTKRRQSKGEANFLGRTHKLIQMVSISVFREVRPLQE